MKKLKLYLDTSVISYLDQKDTPEKMAETRLFWDKIKAGEFEVILSRVTLDELERCNESKRAVLEEYLTEIQFVCAEKTDDVERIAFDFIDHQILPQKCIDDCYHIAFAIVTGCDMIVSWNFKHIVNHKTQTGVKIVSALEGYNELRVCSPEYLTGGIKNDI
jgi:predicted nucleic acid-binding protein